jgi:death-on-curing family protein
MIEYIDLCVEFNATIDAGVVKTDLLHSAFSSYHYYRDIKDQISSVVNGIIKNHPFKDGNKRTALFLLYVLSERYKLAIVDDDHIDDIIVEIAENKYSVEQVSSLLFV